MKLAIGVDIGGTKTKLGLINNQGEIDNTYIFPTSYLKPHKLKDDLINNIAKLIDNCNQEIAGIGIASAGRINFNEKKVVYATDNLKDWAEIPIVKIIEKEFKLPVYIDNDVNAALNCELQLNKPAVNQTIIFLTIGTGLGGALAHNNQILRGQTGSTGEFGHMILYPDGKDCNCGKKGCAEQYISGTAYKERLRKSLKNKDIYRGEEDLKTEIIKNYIIEKNEPYYSVFQNMISDLVYLLESLKNCVDYDVCIIGGGFSIYKDIILKKINEEFKKYNHKYSVKPEFIISRKGNNAGFIGAGLMVFE